MQCLAGFQLGGKQSVLVQCWMLNSVTAALRLRTGCTQPLARGSGPSSDHWTGCINFPRRPTDTSPEGHGGITAAWSGWAPRARSPSPEQTESLSRGKGGGRGYPEPLHDGDEGWLPLTVGEISNILHLYIKSLLHIQRCAVCCSRNTAVSTWVKQKPLSLWKLDSCGTQTQR